MYISSILAVSSLAFLGFAAADTTTFSSVPNTSACGAQPVLEACFSSTTAIIQSCASTDYSCLCQKYTDLVTCFNVCPNDARLAGAQSSKSAYCADASQYPSTTSSAISRAVSAPSTTTNTAATGTGAATGSSGAVRVASSTTDSGSSASASTSSTAKSGAKKELIVGAGRVVMGLAGLAGAFL